MSKRRKNEDEFTIGYTDRSTIKLDLDGTTLKKVKTIADFYAVFYHLEGYIILRTSPYNYHIIFDRSVTWETNCAIMCSIAWKVNKESLLRWVILQVIKRKSTVRVGWKGKSKPPPEILIRFGKQSGEIANYERFCKWLIQ